MEKQYNPSSDWYHRKEFEAKQLTRKGRKIVKKAESYLAGEPITKNKRASKTKENISKYSPQFAAAFTLGFSRIFNRSLSTRPSTKAIPTMEFDRSQLQTSWPQGRSSNGLNQAER